MDDIESAPAFCTRDVGELPIGETCPDCGHTGMAHPFRGNKVDHCQVCELIDQIARTKKWLQGRGLDS